MFRFVRLFTILLLILFLISCTEEITQPNFEDIIEVTREYYAVGYPNPHNGGYCIHFDLLQQAQIKVVIKDSQNITVRHLADDIFEQGSHVIYWNCKDDDENSVSSGIYYVQFNVNGFLFREGMSYIQ